MSFLKPDSEEQSLWSVRRRAEDRLGIDLRPYAFCFLDIFRAPRQSHQAGAFVSNNSHVKEIVSGPNLTGASRVNLCAIASITNKIIPSEDRSLALLVLAWR